jgi:hypothetical protein
MKKESVNVMGLPLERWSNESCVADFGVGGNWATLYHIQSAEQGKGHATKLLIEAKKYYEEQGKRFGGTVALNARMKKIYERLKIKEYE